MIKLFTGSAAVRVAGALAQLLLTLVVTWNAGLVGTAVFFFAFSVVMILSTLSRAGTELSALRVIAQSHARRDDEGLRAAVLGRCFLVASLSTTCAALLFLGGEQLAPASMGTDARRALTWAAIAIPAFAMTGLFTEMLKAVGRPLLGLLFQNLAVPAGSILGLLSVVVWSSGPPRGSDVVAIMCVASWLSLVLAVMVWWTAIRGSWPQHRPTTGSGSPLAEAVAALRDGSRLLAVTAVPIIAQWMGASLLAFFSSPSQVAGYSVAARVSIAASVIHSAATSVVGPRLAVAHESDDMDQMRMVSMQTGLIITALTWPILIAMIGSSSTLLGFFGDTYSSFAPALVVLLVGQLVAALIGHSGMLLVMAGKYDIARVNSVAFLLILTILSLTLVPTWGATGAAIAAAAAAICGHLLGVTLVRSRLGIWTVPTSLADARAVVRNLRSSA